MPPAPAPEAAPAAAPRRRRGLAWLYAAAAAALWAMTAIGSAPLLGRTFPGFLVLDNGILASVHARDWTGPRAGLPFQGGVLVEVDGAPFAGGRALLAHAAARPPGTPIAYRVRAGGTLHAVTVPTMRLGWGEYLQSFGSYLFIAATLLAIAGVALALRPDQLTARSLWAALASVGALFALAVDHMSAYRLIEAYHVFEALAPAAILNLALVFPRERVSRRTRRWLVGGLTGLLMPMALLETATFQARPDLSWRWDAGVYSLMALLGLAMVASFAESLARGRDAAERTRAALVFTGGLVGFLLPASALVSFFLLGIDVPTTWWTPFLALFALFLLYAIVRHDLLEAERVVRLGVGYVLATSGMLVAYAASLAAVSRWAWPGAAQSPVPPFLLVLAVAVSFEPVRERVQRAIDRLFYRSRVDAARVLEESSADLASLATEGEIATYVESLLRDTLDCEPVRVALGPGSEALDPRAPVRAPVTFRAEPLGAIACGAKRSGAPFSAAELDLVHGLAAQAALALHNARTLRALRAAQEHLLRSERLAAVGEFAGAVAHGIRNPLAGIRAAAQVAHLRAGRGESPAESLANVVAEADRLDHRIRSLLDFSRPFQLRARPVEIGRLVAAVSRTLATRAEGQGVALEIAVPDATIDADPDYLEEALLELGQNALRAMPGGGTLCVASAAEDGAVVLRFSDSGGGIPDGVRERIFDLFFTTRREGSGIGLATVRKIVELHGGRVELERTGPDGTTFRVSLPRAG